MKLVATAIALLFGSATAFAPQYMSSLSAVRASSSQTVVFAEPKEEEGGLDLDLEEMFDM